MAQGSRDNKASSVERLPGGIRSFLEDIQGFDTRDQKDRLQTTLKAAYVHRDRRTEMEFRRYH